MSKLVPCVEFEDGKEVFRGDIELPFPPLGTEIGDIKLEEIRYPAKSNPGGAVELYWVTLTPSGTPDLSESESSFLSMMKTDFNWLVLDAVTAHAAGDTHRASKFLAQACAWNRAWNRRYAR